MRNVRWWKFAASIATLFLLTFMLASALGLGFDGTTPLPPRHGALAAVTGVVLLIVDAVLPVPSSLVMIAHGRLFGVAAGAVLSIVGSVGSAMFAFAIGRAASPRIRRMILPEDHQRASDLLARWGVTAVAVTRPVPILAETVALLAGSSPLTWTQTAIAAAAGSIVPALVYAWAGAHAHDANQVAIFGGVLLVTALLWWLSTRWTRRSATGSV